MNYASLVSPLEMRAKQNWMEQALRCLTAPKDKGGTAEVRCLSQTWGSLMLGRSVLVTPLCLAGKEYRSGLGTHAHSDILVKLSRPGRRLRGLAGADDNWSTRKEGAAPMIFSIHISGKEVWKNGPVTDKSKPGRFDIDLKGAREFHLKTFAPQGAACAHADWVDLNVTFDDGASLLLGQRPEAVEGPCFSFTYNGRPSAKLLPMWKLRQEHGRVQGSTKTHKFTWTDPKTLLQCILEMNEYLDFPVVEWVVRFKNKGRKPTPILKDIHSMDLRLDAGLDAFLNYHNGDYQAADCYAPHRVKLEDGQTHTFAPVGGRPTNRAFPYFNVEYPQANCGAILVVGWSGQWSATFECAKNRRSVVAGQELTHFRLLPGEEVRTPMSVVLLWQGDRTRSQNLWRRWMFAHNLPRLRGKLPEPMFHVCMGLRQTEQSQKDYLDAFLHRGIKYTHWWMDAGWYPTKEENWLGVGTWKPDPARFPHGIRALSDHVHKKGMKLIVWFEPERVTPGTELDVEHPEFLLTSETSSEKARARQRDWSGVVNAENKLFNLGNPAAWKWLVERIDGMLVKEGIDLYRQDHNFNPLPFWRENDAPDRQGITEIRCVEGYLAFWDELRRRHPGMLIDSCAGGGRRNDLETLRRGVPLLRSDYTHAQNPQDDPNEYATGNQGHGYSLSSWFPFTGTGTFANVTYVARSYFTPSMGMTLSDGKYQGVDPRDAMADWRQFKLMREQWLRISPFYYGDYYPLTPYSLSEDAWVGWQFHREDLSAGMVQFFRHSKSPFMRAKFPLASLDAGATYLVTDLDELGRKIRATGKELMETGLPVEMNDAPSSALFVYEKR